MSRNSTIRLLCADDHPLIRDGITYALKGEPGIELVAFASNGIEAVEAFKKHRPDVVLLDLQMPGLNGFEAMRAIRLESPKAKCIVLTTYEGDTQPARAIRAGAMGYLLKTMVRKQLVDAIRQCTRAESTYLQRSQQAW